MKRVNVAFAGRVVKFVNREVGMKQIEALAERGTFPVYVVYGPEGCGKTAFFKQAKAILEEFGYSVIHLNPLAKTVEERFSISEELVELARELGAFLLRDAYSLIEKAVEILYTAIRRGIRKRIAFLADDVFQAVGVDKAEQLVKALLNMIEWPPVEYEKIVVLVSSSEGVTRERIGRHRWATFRLMWNMSREGFEELYRLLPDPKPSFEDVWRITGGNPAALEQLYSYGWRLDDVVADFIRSRKLRSFIAALSENERKILEEAVHDPDVIFERLREPETQQLEKKLVELNLIIEVWERESGWIDIPPPEKDPELGIGKFYAWQTPLHREAIRKVLGL